MSASSLKIGVIGGGIGGLTAAVALHQAGFDVDLYEQAPELTEIGGGINMGPNAVRVLRRLGLGHPGAGRADLHGTKAAQQVPLARAVAVALGAPTARSQRHRPNAAVSSSSNSASMNSLFLVWRDAVADRNIGVAVLAAVKH